jgi:hypothetical protein
MMNRNLLTKELTQFIQELANLMTATTGDKINIQIGKNPVYTGIIGQEPELSKLTDARVGILRTVINQPEASSKIKQTIVLSHNQQEVFVFVKGQVVVNNLISKSDLVVSMLPASTVSAFESDINDVTSNVKSSLPEDDNIRAVVEQFLGEKERLVQIQREENSKNWLWYQIAKIEDGHGEYFGSVSVDAIRELAISKAPVPAENLIVERDASVTRASQFVLRIALKVISLEGKEVIPGVKTSTSGGYTITYNEATGDLSIDKPNQTYLRHDTGKIERSYRPGGILKAKYQEITYNKLLTKDLANFDYIECRLLTKECLPSLQDMVDVHGSECKGKIETWTGGKKEDAKIENVLAKSFISYKANIQIIKLGKHLQVRDVSGNLIMKAYGDKVEKPMTRVQIQDWTARYTRFTSYLAA